MQLQRLLISFVLIVLPLGSVFSGEVSVSYNEPEEFEDFSLHELRSTEDAVIIFEKQIKRYWEQRLSDLVPDGWSLNLEFTEIDMGGDIQPWRHPTNDHLRYYAERFYPRLFFNYTFTNAEGEVMKEGEAKVLDKNFLFGGKGRMVRDTFAFGYELEALRKWLEKLELKDESQS